MQCVIILNGLRCDVLQILTIFNQILYYFNFIKLNFFKVSIIPFSYF